MANYDANPQWDVDFQFTIADGKVTAMQAVMGRHAIGLPVPKGASFTVDADTVTQTLKLGGATQVITYAHETGSTTLYNISEVTTTYTNLSTAREGYAFNVYDGVVSGGEHVTINHGHTRVEASQTPLDTIYSGGSGLITEQYLQGNVVTTTTFTQPAGSSLYAVSSVEKTIVDPGAATTLLDVDPSSRAEFTFDASGAVTQAQELDPRGGLHTVTDSHVTFTQLAPGYVEEVTIRGSSTSYAVYFEGTSGEGIYTEIAHGRGSTVDLAGLQAQVEQAEHLLPTTAYTSPGWVI
jgi:hypothetical protein